MKKNRQKQYQPCRFLPFSQTRKSRPPTGTLWFDVSSRAEAPYDTLSPFYVHGEIPVPGMPGTHSDTVEGIWQGLKVIRGKMAPRYFHGWGRKRGGKPAGHRYGDRKRLLKLVEARRKIYIPAYEWVLENKISRHLIDDIIERAFRGIPQFFHDVEENGAIGKDLPLAHASVLVRWLNKQCEFSSRFHSEHLAVSGDDEIRPRN